MLLVEVPASQPLKGLAAWLGLHAVACAHTHTLRPSLALRSHCTPPAARLKPQWDKFLMGRIPRLHGRNRLTNGFTEAKPMPLWAAERSGARAESKLKGVALRIWPLNLTANGRNFNADLAKTVPAAETAKQGFSAVTRKNRLSKGTN